MKTVFRLTLLAPIALMTACHKEAPAPEASASAEASAPVSEGKAGLSASDGKLVLPAVKGNPGAAYFMLSNSNTKAATFAGVAIEGAKKAEMHESKGGAMAPIASLEVRPGEMVMFERGGKHVMVFDLAPTIKPGDTVQMTMTFSDGAKVSLPLAVEAAGGGQSMNHGAMH